MKNNKTFTKQYNM